MNKNIEEVFVKTFIDKNKRNRVMYELFNSNKRGECIRRLPSNLSHVCKQIAIKNDEDIYKAILINKVMSPIYIISDDERIDGKFEQPEKALNHALIGGSTYILLFDHAIFIKEEIGYSSPKYILFIDK